jgi:hypothetical protein
MPLKESRGDERPFRFPKAFTPDPMARAGKSPAREAVGSSLPSGTPIYDAFRWGHLENVGNQLHSLQQSTCKEIRLSSRVAAAGPSAHTCRFTILKSAEFDTLGSAVRICRCELRSKKGADARSTTYCQLPRYVCHRRGDDGKDRRVPTASPVDSNVPPCVFNGPNPANPDANDLKLGFDSKGCTMGAWTNPLILSMS